MKVIGIKKDGSQKELAFFCTQTADRLCVSVPKEQTVGEHFEIVRIKSKLTSRKTGDEGYMFFPASISMGVVRCSFSKREDAVWESLVSLMPVCGIGGTKDAVLVMVKGGDADCRFRASVQSGIYELSPEFLLDGDDAYEDLFVEYLKMPYATYADMAKVYRKYQMDEKGCKSIKEKMADRPALAYACESMEFRIRMGWKPVPTPVKHQTPETEPPLKVVCDLNKLRRLMHAMKEQGIERAEFCLVGWNIGGHDGRFPQLYPSDERFGGDEALRACIREAHELGYRVVCHTGSVEAYEIANNWDPEKLVHTEQNHQLVPKQNPMYANGGLSGGIPYFLCAKCAYEHYAKQDLPVVQSYGFSGLHFIDELTAVKPEKCYHKDHPVNRREALEYYRSLAKLSTELFGGFQSEAWMDFMNADVDYIMYTAFKNEVSPELHPLFDELIPFWQLVYHGIVLSNPNSCTVNYTLKSAREHLRFIEYGGRPLMYLYSKFGENKNWMGDIDLAFETEDELDACVKAVKEAYDEYELLKHLQYEFMDNHEKLAEGVYRTTYSDGTQIVVDYNKETFEVIAP